MSGMEVSKQEVKEVRACLCHPPQEPRREQTF